MSGADECLAAGDLEGARATLVAAVRNAPGDQAARLFLLQLLMISGEWDKAAAQARALVGLDPQAEMLSVLCNQLIAGEREREAAFAGQAPFKAHFAASGWVDDLVGALNAWAAGDLATAQTLRDAAFDAAPDTPGDCDGRPFDWVADADPRFGPCLEVIVAGSWGLLPLDAIASIDSDGAQELRDLAWLPVKLAMRSGQSAAAFLPTRYPGAAAESAPLRLARGTEWRDGPFGALGAGQRLLAFSDGEDLPILSMRRLVFSGSD